MQAHINDVVHDCRYAVETNGGLPTTYEHAANFDLHINDIVRSVRGGEYFHPAQTLLRHCLGHFSGFDEAALQGVSQCFYEVQRQTMEAMPARRA